MKYIISDRQKNILLEYERKQQDVKYLEQYNRIKGGLIKYFESIIDSYSEDDDSISLYDKNNKRLFTYRKKTNELYYNRDINYEMTDLLPTYIWSRHGDYIMSDVYNHFFDDKVRNVWAAGMI